MKVAKKSSDRYHDYLIASLRDPEEAAAYLEVALEEDFDPKLLRKAFMNVLEALGSERLTPEQLTQCYDQTNHLFESASSGTVYEFVNWFSNLGLKVTIGANCQMNQQSDSSVDLAVLKEHT
jgi:hypothetical protein